MSTTTTEAVVDNVKEGQQVSIHSFSILPAHLRNEITALYTRVERLHADSKIAPNAGQLPEGDLQNANRSRPPSPGLVHPSALADSITESWKGRPAFIKGLLDTRVPEYCAVELRFLRNSVKSMRRLIEHTLTSLGQSRHAESNLDIPLMQQLQSDLASQQGLRVMVDSKYISLLPSLEEATHTLKNTYETEDWMLVHGLRSVFQHVKSSTGLDLELAKRTMIECSDLLAQKVDLLQNEVSRRGERD